MNQQRLPDSNLLYQPYYLYYKQGFWLSGNPLHFNMGPQWQIYFLQSINAALYGMLFKQIYQPNVTWAHRFLAPNLTGMCISKLHVCFTHNYNILTKFRPVNLNLLFLTRKIIKKGREGVFFFFLNDTRSCMHTMNELKLYKNTAEIS